MARFEKGNKASAGVPKPMAGRPTDWLREKCREAGPQVIQFLIEVATGKDMEQVVNDQGETIGVPAAVKDRIKATEVILDRGYGKPEQTINTGDGSELAAFPTAQLQALIAALEGGSAPCSQSGTGQTTVQ